MKCASESGLDTTKGLLNDVSTRWNSTYLMLADAIYYRAAFDRLTSYDRRRYEKMCPSAAEWEKAMKIRAFLKRFFDLTELFSGTLYPTANLFYKGFCDIKIILTDWSKGKDSDITIRRMATAMLAKFDKYWNKSNTALAVASFLDPRFKMRIVQFCMEFIHQDMHPIKVTEFLNIIRNMYDCYASAAPPRNHNAFEPIDTPDANQDPTEFVSALDKYLYRAETHNTSSKVNDLEKYLSEETLKVTKANESTFDILAWWKNQKDTYHVLSLLARDVLAMQASTVASESAFSAGGRVVDPYCSRLDSEMAQALICTKDWIAGVRRGKNYNSLDILFMCNNQ